MPSPEKRCYFLRANKGGRSITSLLTPQIMKTTPRTDNICFTGKGQVVIPRWLRKDSEVEEDTRAFVYQEGDNIVLKPIAPSHSGNLRGSLKGSGLLKALMGDRKRERELK
jgi:bifunctional DNA-binding transcriptional regulator/antitoxin component of YhaV-PrlF toxin-antitoxin module